MGTLDKLSEHLDKTGPLEPGLATAEAIKFLCSEIDKLKQSKKDKYTGDE